MGERLPSHARWLEHRPIAYTSGWLYFEVELYNRTMQYIKVRGSRKRVNYWLNLLTFHIANVHSVLLLNTD